MKYLFYGSLFGWIGSCFALAASGRINIGSLIAGLLPLSLGMAAIIQKVCTDPKPTRKP